MNEGDPVEDGELVYRRIHRSFFDASVIPPVRKAGFRPNQHDTTGISVFRAQFLHPIDTLANIDRAKANNYFVARLSVRDLHQLGLTVVPEPIPGGPRGHAVIPELNCFSFKAKQHHWKPILMELAKLASVDIVHRLK